MSIWKNLIWGVRWGLAFAAVFILWALLLLVSRGTAAFEANDATPLAVVGSYLFGGIGAGAVVGLLRPLTRRKAGSTVVGIVAMFPVFLGIRVADKGFSPWTERDTFIVTAMSLLGGSLAGWMLHEVFHDE
jgi:hypothetical protein